MQLINVLKGGTLYQHIPTDLPDAQDHHSSTKAKDLEHFAHTLRIDPASRLARIVHAEHIRTNTHHHQAIKQLGEGLIATAWSEDGIIEAVEITDYPFMIGIESHPESLTRVEPVWKQLFESFVAAAKR
jgi:putative glutamine amidotransferase